MALTDAQRAMGQELLDLYGRDQQAGGHFDWTVTFVLDMTQAQRKAALLPYAQARRSNIQATQAALPAQRDAEDARLAADLTTAIELITILT